MAATTFTATAVQGETLDALVWRVLEAGSGVVEQVLELNPGIADLGPVLTEGLVITLPVITAAPVAVSTIVKLWE
ncbi:tail protein X [Asticcacaulis solisilvae]|uniref:tail protein X n=1 Tax=Asticcacaulis solisilvae TaxID=1217274 RepID=UPI003FD84AC7